MAHEVWNRFGDVSNYVEPFFGSGAVLLKRPQPFEGSETINDACGYVSNFWRAVKAAPEAVAEHADNPVNENDLHARHIWLLARKDELATRLEGDPEWFDAKIAGWWCWGICCWIGSGWCSGNGPWQAVDMEDGSRQLVHLGDAGRGVNRKLVHLGDAGKGVNRKLVHLAPGRGVNRQLVHLAPGRGVNRQRVHLGDAGRGVKRKREDLFEQFASLSERLRGVRVCSGDWTRLTSPTVTVKQGLTAVFLDPPYADTANRDKDLYRVDSLSVSHAVREWAVKWGDDPMMRIALCGYEGEHVMPDTWEKVAWKARGGYATQGSKGNENARKERVWFSPHCLESELPLFRSNGHAMKDAS